MYVCMYVCMDGWMEGGRVGRERGGREVRSGRFNGLEAFL